MSAEFDRERGELVDFDPNLAVETKYKIVPDGSQVKLTAVDSFVLDGPKREIAQTIVDGDLSPKIYSFRYLDNERLIRVNYNPELFDPLSFSSSYKVLEGHLLRRPSEQSLQEEAHYDHSGVLRHAIVTFQGRTSGRGVNYQERYPQENIRDLVHIFELKGGLPKDYEQLFDKQFMAKLGSQDDPFRDRATALAFSNVYVLCLDFLRQEGGSLGPYAEEESAQLYLGLAKLVAVTTIGILPSNKYTDKWRDPAVLKSAMKNSICSLLLDYQDILQNAGDYAVSIFPGKKIKDEFAVRWQDRLDGQSVELKVSQEEEFDVGEQIFIVTRNDDNGPVTLWYRHANVRNCMWIPVRFKSVVDMKAFRDMMRNRDHKEWPKVFELVSMP